MSNFKRGDQVLYIPGHAGGDPNHPDVEAGFVTSVTVSGETVFCRYWRDRQCSGLRTLANSEGTPPGMLVHHVSTPQYRVDTALLSISRGDDPS